jgi:hypothetical protein
MQAPAGKPHFVYCRPHVKTITAEMRFIVVSERGVDLGDRKFKAGDEFPVAAVSEYILRCLYEQRRIDLMPANDQPTQDDLDPKAVGFMNHKQLQDLCTTMGLQAAGSKTELRERLLNRS